MVLQQFLISYQSNQVAFLTAAAVNNYSQFVAHQQWTRDIFTYISENQRDSAALHFHLLAMMDLLRASLPTYVRD